MKKQFIFSALILLFTYSIMYGQESSKNNLASINNDFVISLNRTVNTKLKKEYQIDISSFNFKSLKGLNQFCKRTSSGFHKFIGDFSNKIIKIEFNINEIREQEMTIEEVNNYLFAVSVKLKNAYNDLKNL